METVRDCWSAVVEGLDEFEGGNDDEDDGGDFVLDEEYSSMVQVLRNSAKITSCRIDNDLVPMASSLPLSTKIYFMSKQ